MSRNYSKDIAIKIINYMNENNWNYDFDQENGIIHFIEKLNNEIDYVDYIITININEYIVRATSSFSIQDNIIIQRTMDDFFRWANSRLVFGFLSYQKGIVVFKHTTDCSDILPSKSMIWNSLLIPAGIIDSYSNEICDILYRGENAVCVINNCKNSLDKSYKKFKTMKKEIGIKDGERISEREMDEMIEWYLNKQ